MVFALRIRGLVVLAAISIITPGLGGCFDSTVSAVPITCVDGPCPDGLICNDVVDRCLPATREPSPPTMRLETPSSTTPRGTGLFSMILVANQPLFQTPTVTASATTSTTTATAVVTGSGTRFTATFVIEETLAGVVNLRAEATNLDGDTAVSDLGTIVVDSSPPTLRSSAVSPALINAAGTADVDVVFDESVAVTDVRASGTSVVFLVENDSDDAAAPTRLTIDGAVLAACCSDGLIDLAATVADVAGNVALVTLGSIGLDTRAPLMLSSSLTPLAARPGVPFAVSVVGDEPLTTTATRVRGAEVRTLEAVSVLGTTATVSFAVDAVEVGGVGTWDVVMVLADDAGNETTVTVGGITVDDTPPTFDAAIADAAVRLDRAPFGRGANSVAVTRLHIDRALLPADVDHVEAFIPGSTFAIGSSAGDILELPPLDLPDVAVAVVDAVGNRSAPQRVHRVQLTVPGGTAGSSATGLVGFSPTERFAGPAIGGRLTIDGNATDVDAATFIAAATAATRPQGLALIQNLATVTITSTSGTFVADAGAWVAAAGVREPAGTVAIRGDRFRPCDGVVCPARITLQTTRETSFALSAPGPFVWRGGLLFGVEGPFFIRCFEGVAGAGDFTACDGQLFTFNTLQPDVSSAIQVFPSTVPSDLCTPQCHVPDAAGGDLVGTNQGLFLLSPTEHALLSTTFGGWSVADNDVDAGVYHALDSRLAFDEDRGVLVAVIDTGAAIETWEFAGGWTRRTDSGGPAVRVVSAAHIPGLGAVFVDDDSVASVLDASGWRTIARPEAAFPDRAAEASLVFDHGLGHLLFHARGDTASFVVGDDGRLTAFGRPSNQVGARFAPGPLGALVFGGNIIEPLRRFDVVDGWLPVPVTGDPVGRANAGIAALGDTVVLFGGVDEVGDLDPSTWVLDASGTWTELDIAGPDPRFRHAMATDPVSQRVIVVGGVDGTERSLDTVGAPPILNSFRDAWAFDGAGWERLDDLPFRGSANFLTLGAFDCGLVFDDDLGAVVLVGGRQIVDHQDATLSEDARDIVAVLEGRSWRTVSVVGDPRWVNRDPRGAFDPTTHRIVLAPSTPEMATGLAERDSPSSTPASSLDMFSLSTNPLPAGVEVSWSFRNLVPAAVTTGTVDVVVVGSGLHGTNVGADLWQGAPMLRSDSHLVPAPAPLSTSVTLDNTLQVSVVLAAVDASTGPSRVTFDGAEATLHYTLP